MNKVEKKPFDVIKKMSLDLDLVFERQDWGIINANAARFNIFLDYYYEQIKPDDTKKYYLGELIIASFNEMLISVEYQVTDIEFDKFKKFISKINFPLLTDYWKSLNHSDEFKVSKYINQALSV